MRGAGNVPCASANLKTARESVASRLGRIALGVTDEGADDSRISPARRGKALRALSSLTRTHFPSRRAFFAAGGAETLARLFDARDEKTRKRAHALATDMWVKPDVAGGPASRGYPPGRQDEELQMARDLTPRRGAARGAGSSDAREKAMGALEAAVERVAGAKKPFLGGYRSRKTKLEYHHACTQTDPPPRPRADARDLGPRPAAAE